MSTNETILYRITQLERMLEKHTDQDTENFAAITELLTAVRIDIQGLKVQAGTWGGIAGLIASAVVSGCIGYFFTYLPSLGG